MATASTAGIFVISGDTTAGPHLTTIGIVTADTIGHGTDEIMVAIVFISQIMAGATIISGMLELFPVR